MISIKEYVAKRKEEIKEYLQSLDRPLHLAIIQVGDNPASNSYIKGKLKDCAEVGVEAELVKLEESITEEALLDLINHFNSSKAIDGLIVQLPLPKHINETTVAEAIVPEKDVDGFSRLALVSPATPQGIIDYLEYNNYEFVDKNAVVISRSNIVGRPVAKLLLDRSCNVSVIHSKTSEANKNTLLMNADLIICATGHRNTITDKDLTKVEFDATDRTTKTYHNTRAFIVDVGINRNDEGKLCGDCEAVTVCEKTPVPGGVGLTTRLALITNLIKLHKIVKKKLLIIRAF